MPPRPTSSIQLPVSGGRPRVTRTRSSIFPSSHLPAFFFFFSSFPFFSSLFSYILLARHSLLLLPRPARAFRPNPTCRSFFSRKRLFCPVLSRQSPPSVASLLYRAFSLSLSLSFRRQTAKVESLHDGPLFPQVNPLTSPYDCSYYSVRSRQFDPSSIGAG